MPPVHAAKLLVSSRDYVISCQTPGKMRGYIKLGLSTRRHPACPAVSVPILHPREHQVSFVVNVVTKRRQIYTSWTSQGAARVVD